MQPPELNPQYRKEKESGEGNLKQKTTSRAREMTRMCLIPRTHVRKPNTVAHICNPSTPTVRQQGKQENLPQVLESTSLEYAARNRDPALETKRRRELTQESIPLTSLCTLWFGLGFYSLFVCCSFVWWLDTKERHQGREKPQFKDCLL